MYIPIRANVVVGPVRSFVPWSIHRVTFPQLVVVIKLCAITKLVEIADDSVTKYLSTNATHLRHEARWGICVPMGLATATHTHTE